MNTAAGPNKTDAGNGSYRICRVIDASRTPSPDPSLFDFSRGSYFENYVDQVGNCVWRVD